MYRFLMALIWKTAYTYKNFIQDLPHMHISFITLHLLPVRKQFYKKFLELITCMRALRLFLKMADSRQLYKKSINVSRIPHLYLQT